MALPQPALGRAIRAARERLDISQEELGSRVGRSRSAVNAWEAGRAVPMRSIAKLEDVLGVSLGGAGEPDEPPRYSDPALQRIADDPALEPDVKAAMINLAVRMREQRDRNGGRQAANG